MVPMQRQLNVDAEIHSHSEKERQRHQIHHVPRPSQNIHNQHEQNSAQCQRGKTQADVTSTNDLWATRTYIMNHMGGKAPNLVICNSGLTEKGYSFGRSLREVEGESMAMRRARVRQAFVNNLAESRAVIDTKIDGFLAMTHLWSGEAVYANDPLISLNATPPVAYSKLQGVTSQPARPRIE